MTLRSVAIAGNLVIDAICVAVVGGSGAVVFVLEKFAALVFGRTSADTFIFEPHARRTCTEAVYTPLQRPTGRNVGEIDQAKTLAKSAFPLKPAKLVDKARNVIATMFGTLDHDVLADDFRFVAPVVGPLGKQEFIRVFGSFKLEDALPDLQENHWGFHVDPLEPNRVWWLSRPQGTHTGPLRFPPPNVIQPTNRAVQWPVQAQSMLFDEQGRCYQLTVGYSCDRQTGNTGGLGAVFGLMHAVGKTLPFPEGRPWKPSAPYRMGLRLAKVAERFGFGPGLTTIKS